MAISREVKKELEHLAEQAFECGEPNIPEDLSQAVKIAADYAARHYREAVGLGDAAEAAGVNSTYLSYLFSQEMGIGFANYLLNLRMEHAKKLLRETNLKMWQVAEESDSIITIIFQKYLKKQRGCGAVPEAFLKIKDTVVFLYVKEKATVSFFACKYLAKRKHERKIKK